MAYGTTYVIFPIGKYKLMWSPKVRDLYDHLSNKFWSYIRFLKKRWWYKICMIRNGWLRTRTVWIISSI
jgi:hypothetical protein